MGNDDFWKGIINSLDVPFPTDGEAMPSIEAVSPTEKDAAVIRLSFDMYLLSPVEETGKVYMVNAGQRMEDLGTMQIKEALIFIKKRNAKKP